MKKPFYESSIEMGEDIEVGMYISAEDWKTAKFPTLNHIKAAEHRLDEMVRHVKRKLMELAPKE